MGLINPGQESSVLDCVKVDHIVRKKKHDFLNFSWIIVIIVDNVPMQIHVSVRNLNFFTI